MKLQQHEIIMQIIDDAISFPNLSITDYSQIAKVGVNTNSLFADIITLWLFLALMIFLAPVLFKLNKNFRVKR